MTIEFWYLRGRSKSTKGQVPTRVYVNLIMNRKCSCMSCGVYDDVIPICHERAEDNVNERLPVPNGSSLRGKAWGAQVSDLLTGDFDFVEVIPKSLHRRLDAGGR